MKRLPLEQRHLALALLLGAGALVWNSVAHLMSSGVPQPYGNVLLFVAAMSLGLPATVVAISVALMPQCLNSGFSPDIIMRTALPVLAVCLASERLLMVPAHLVVAATWLLVVGPLSAFSISSDAIIARAFVDTLLALVAGTALLHDDLWGPLAGRVRRASLENLFRQMSALLVLCPLGLLFLVTEATLLVPFFVAGLALAEVTGAYISRLLVNDHERYFPTLLRQALPARLFGGATDNRHKRDNDHDNHVKVSAAAIQAPFRLSEFRSPDRGLCTVDKSGTILSVNSTWERLFGTKERNLVGTVLAEASMSTDLRHHLVRLVDTTQLRGARLTEVRLPSGAQSGAASARYFEIASLPARELNESASNLPVGSVILSARDITESRTVEAHELFRHRLTTLGSVVGGLAHSFTNSLTSILGHASVARGQTSDAELSAALQLIEQAARDASLLLGDLQNFALRKTGDLRQLDVAQLLTRQMPLLQSSIGEQFDINLQLPEEPVGVFGDESLLEDVVSNLVFQARDSYGPAGGPIEISITSESIDEAIADMIAGAHAGHFARIQVRDNGAAMSSESLSEALKGRENQKATPIRRSLSLVLAMVRAHDGFLSVESTTHKGTTVSVYLPLREVPVAVVDDQASAQGAHHLTKGSSAHILVVEDEDMIRELVTKMLGALGYDVTKVASGSSALELAKQKKFDLVLVDMVMPRMNGTELIRNLRAELGDASPRVLMMTGYGDTGEQPKSVPILAKPFDMNNLRQAIEDSLHRTDEPEKLVASTQ